MTHYTFFIDTYNVEKKQCGDAKKTTTGGSRQGSRREKRLTVIIEDNQDQRDSYRGRAGGGGVPDA